MPGEGDRECNIIALCFTMTCSYDPPMIAVSIEKKNYSYDLIRVASNFVLAVPGESIAQQAMSCGLLSGRDVDKFKECGLTKQSLHYGHVPGIAEAIANIELSVESQVDTGDHITVIGRVLGYYVNPQNIEKNLLAVGPNSQGYKLLVRKGLHRIAVVEGGHEDYLKEFKVNRLFHDILF
nr:flavin reductase family protein [Pseudomonas monteilii]